MPEVLAAIPAILSAIGSAGAGVAGTIAGGAEALGAGSGLAAAIGGAGTGALEGAALGAGEAALTHGNILKGAEFGGLTGGAIGGIGPALGGALGGGATANFAGDLLAGAGAGALGGKITGGNVGTDALLGGVGGAAAGLPGLLSSAGTPGAGGGAGGGGGLSAASGAAPAGVGAGTPSASLDINQLGSINTSAPLTAAAGGAGASAGPGSIGTVNPAAGAPGVAAGSGAGGGLLSSLTKKPGVLLSGGILGLDALKGNQMPKGFNQLQTQADKLAQQGGQLQSYLQTGTLPPGVQQSINSAADSAQASIRQQYASRGMSGSSAEAQDLQHVAETVASQGATIATNLLQQGISETNMADQMYAQLMQVRMQQDAQLSSAVGNFASALALGSRPVTGGASAG